VVGTLPDAVSSSLRSGAQALEHPAAVHHHGLYVQVRIFEAGVFVFGLPVGYGRQQYFFEYFGAGLGLKARMLRALFTF
jgi:hypothetical protein